jgi:DNA-binding transcriptional MerR regulator
MMITYLTAADAAQVLGLSASSVRLMVRLGTIQVAAKTKGGISLFRQRDVERLARKREVNKAVSGTASQTNS